MTRLTNQPDALAMVQKVREIAAVNPDRVYRPSGNICKYSRGRDGYGCIIGQAFVALGVPIEELEKIDDLRPGLSVDSFYEDDSDEVRWLMSVQSGQDYGDKFRNAVIYADYKVSLDNSLAL